MEDAQLEKVQVAFQESFDGDARIFRAPGRVNLIGEHTDYNDGFVMPFAIDRDTLTAGVARRDTIINVNALETDERATIDLAGVAVKRRGTWLDYVEGTARSLQDRFGLNTGADLVFTSTVPIGSGLSSSAALEVSIGYALLVLAGIDIDREKLALAAQYAEHEFVGIRSGIMDQFTSTFARAGHAMLLDCRSREIRQIPLAIEGTMIFVCDTKVKHELASSEYNTRRKECEEGVRILSRKLPNIKALRDVTPADLDKLGSELSETVLRRCRHVVTENERTIAAAEALTNGDAERTGQLMFDSHRSLKDDYEVSSVELDTLVDSAKKVEGVFGARMTGGGFGGCTVNLLDVSVSSEFEETVRRSYEKRFGFQPEIYVFEAADGASEVDP
jgi:galactokinase